MKDMKQETGTEKKEDRRVRRTKKLLSQGLIELMQQKQVKDITAVSYTHLLPYDESEAVFNWNFVF